ncbi:MAG: hypothetical protein BWY89_01781 [Bacteroidetes bacterium ADurb.BinA012]|nr:MAG: hypothetical protein BWY89_01781 [Bacteroidetes bacterium ADurb.BinA012]
MVFSIAKVITPPMIEIMAELLLLFRNHGNSPRIMGMEIGPTSAANHVIISPKTPPNESE